MPRKDLARRLARITRDLSQLLEHALAPTVPASVKTRFEKAILQVLSNGESMPGKRIATKSGYAYGGRLRATLADLVRRGVLTHSPDGYRLAKVNGTGPSKS